MNKLIEVKDLSYCYGRHEVLAGISLDIDKNDLLYIMGNNGSGKTTLLKCLLGFLKPRSGEIKINGIDNGKIAQKNLAKQISYVPQNITLNNDYKVKDYLVLGRNPYINAGNPTNKDYETVEKYANETGVETLLYQGFQTLSWGQKQWVSITRALVQETPIMIMDEPMSALDLGKQAELLLLLSKLKKIGKTVILTSHNPIHAFVNECNVCLINNKKILSFGAGKEVLNNENINSVYGKNVMINQQMGSLSFNLNMDKVGYE